VFPVGPWIAGFSELRIVGPLFVFGQVQFDTSFAQTNFVVSNPPQTVTLYTLPATTLGLTLGLALRTD
jgi:hypothetical protein